MIYWRYLGYGYCERVYQPIIKSPFPQIVPPKFLESLMEACHSNSYERLENAVKVSIQPSCGYIIGNFIRHVGCYCRRFFSNTDRQPGVCCVCICVSIYLCLSVCLSVRQLHDLVVDQVELNDKQKSIICERIGVSHCFTCRVSILFLS